MCVGPKANIKVSHVTMSECIFYLLEVINCSNNMSMSLVHEQLITISMKEAFLQDF